MGEGKWIGKKKKLKFSLYQSFFEVLTLLIPLCMTAHTIPTKFLEPNTNQVFILGFSGSKILITWLYIYIYTHTRCVSLNMIQAPFSFFIFFT